MVPLRPGSSWTSPGETAKSCTTMTCGRGSGALVSIWLEPWVQAASNVNPMAAVRRMLVLARLIIRSVPAAGRTSTPG